MERGNLTFLKTLTVEQFKREKGVTEIEVLQNNKEGGKIFMAFGSETGAVATKGIPEKPMVSLVQGEVTERNPDGKFWMLHEKGVGAATVLNTL